MRIICQIRYLRSLFLFSPFEVFLFRIFNKQNQHNTNNKRVVVVQCVKDPYYLVLWGIIINQLRENIDFSVHVINTSGFVVGESKGLKAYVYGKLTQGYLSDRKWIKLFGTFCDKIAYNHSGVVDALCHSFELIEAVKKWKAIYSEEELLALSFGSTPVGDLVYDTYLRFKPYPTLDISDPYLILVLWRALRCHRKANQYFKQIKPKLFFTSYTTYVQHGVAARVAISLGIPVVSFGNPYDLYKCLTATDSYHTRNTVSYKTLFERLIDTQERLENAEYALKNRLSGGIDAATFYMKQSAYLFHQETLPDVKGKRVIFLHDFFDSPHVYGELLFPDFWKWVCVTFDILLKHNISFVVKPHPNQVPEAKVAVETLMGLYPQVEFISSKFSNVQLVEGGISMALTVYGTVAHEMAYLGVPTLACGSNPHQSYSFSKVAHTLGEYEELLLNPHLIKQDTEYMKNESLSFYYMHNLFGSREELALRETVLNLRRSVQTDNRDRFSDQQTLEAIKSFEEALRDSGKLEDLGIFLNR